MKPGQRREVARWAVAEHPVSKRRACNLLSISLGCFWYESRRKGDDEVVEVLTRLAESRPRWGFGLMFDWIRMHEYVWNHKRVYRVYKELALNLRIKPKKRLPSRDPVPLDQAQKPNDCWSLDFMSDSLANGRPYRTLNVIDDFNRESLAIEIDHSLPSERVVRVLDQVAEDRGYPKKLRSDNGPELIAATLERWAARHGVQQTPIQPGKPTQNAYVERFNRTYRQEVLDVYAFSNLDEVRDESTRWQYSYNSDRPHTALGRQTPWGYLRAHLASKDQPQEVAAGILPPPASPVPVNESCGGRIPTVSEMSSDKWKPKVSTFKRSDNREDYTDSGSRMEVKTQGVKS